MHAPFDKEVECNLASSAQDFRIRFPTREPRTGCWSGRIRRKRKRQRSCIRHRRSSNASRLYWVFCQPHRLSAFRTGRDARVLESWAEPQQRLTHKAPACCSRKREEISLCRFTLLLVGLLLLLAADAQRVFLHL